MLLLNQIDISTKSYLFYFACHLDENSDSDHHYESLYTANDESHYDDYDSFESDSESEKSFNKGVTLVNNVFITFTAMARCFTVNDDFPFMQNMLKVVAKSHCSVYLIS